MGTNTYRWRLLLLQPVHTSCEVAKEDLARGSDFNGKCARSGAGADRAAHDQTKRFMNCPRQIAKRIIADSSFSRSHGQKAK